MVQIEQLTNKVFIISNHVNYGIIKAGEDACIVVDTGIDDDSGKLILDAVASLSLKVQAIINTHSHADHYGGNHYLVKHSACTVYAPRIEAAIMENPELESIYIYGANPPAELTTRFLRGKRSPVDVVIDAGALRIGEADLTIVPLAGHSPNQIGVMVDGVFFCGDAIFSEQAWNKFLLVYGFNIGEMRESALRICRTDADAFVASHISLLRDVRNVCTVNIAKIDMLIADVTEIIREPVDVTTVLQRICLKHNIQISTMQQYYLSLDTLKAYLSYLLESGVAATSLVDNALVWHIKE